MLTLYRLEECLGIIYTDDGNCENFSCFWCFAYFFNIELEDQKQSLEMCIASLFFGWITLGLNRCPFEYCNPSLFPAIFDSNCPELTIQIYLPICVQCSLAGVLYLDNVYPHLYLYLFPYLHLYLYLPVENSYQPSCLCVFVMFTCRYVSYSSAAAVWLDNSSDLIIASWAEYCKCHQKS